MKQEVKTNLTKRKILNAAMQKFGENGYSGASLNAICDTGISKGLLYHNFKNKDAVYLACVKQSFCNLTDYLKRQNIGSDPQKYMATRLCYFREHENEARLFFEAVLQPPQHLQVQIAELKSDFDALNRQLYRQILSTVTLRKGLTQEDAMSFFALMQNIFNSYFSSPACQEMSFSDRMTSHESTLPKLLDYMLYGIAERGKEI